MKYFVVTHTIRDGEYEYLQQSPVMAEDEDSAIELESQELREWVGGDYRLWEIDRVEEVSEEEFAVIKKYIL